MSDARSTTAPAKVALRARCICPRRPTVPVRVFAEVAARLRARLGDLPPELLSLPLADVRCREKRCDHNVPLTVGDLLGYE